MTVVSEPEQAVAAAHIPAQRASQAPPSLPPTMYGSPARRLATRIVGYSVLVFFALVFIYPFVIQLASSFKTESDAAANPLSPVPAPVTTASIERIFAGTGFPTWLGNSVLMAVLVTLGRVFFDSLAGYALAASSGPGRAVHLRHRHHGCARSRPAHPEVPGAQTARPVRQLRRPDHPAAGRRDRHLHHEAVVRVDPGPGRGGRPHRRRRHLPDVLVGGAADDAPS